MLDPESVIRRALAEFGYHVSAVHIATHHGIPNYRVCVVECDNQGRDRTMGDLFDSFILQDPVLVRAWVESVWEPLPTGRVTSGVR